MIWIRNDRICFVKTFYKKTKQNEFSLLKMLPSRVMGKAGIKTKTTQSTVSQWESRLARDDDILAMFLMWKHHTSIDRRIYGPCNSRKDVFIRWFSGKKTKFYRSLMPALTVDSRNCQRFMNQPQILSLNYRWYLYRSTVVCSAYWITGVVLLPVVWNSRTANQKESRISNYVWVGTGLSDPTKTSEGFGGLWDMRRI